MILMRYEQPKWLQKKYWNERKTLQEVADLGGVSLSTIKRKMVKFGISRRNKGHRGNYINPTSRSMEILEGCLLGDGGLRASKTSVWFRYACKYRDCIIYLQNVLRNEGFKTPNKIPFYGGVWHYESKQYRSGLWELYENWYPDGHKVIPRSFKLTRLKLLWWYLGDGNLNKQQRTIKISTLGFLREDVLILVKELRTLGITCSIHQKEIPKTYGSGMEVYIWKHSNPTFFSLMGNCPTRIRQCFGYKWEWKQIKKPR